VAEPAPGRAGEELTFGAEDGYLAMPAAGRGRGVLVVGEGDGAPAGRVRDAADSLAGLGFVALAVAGGEDGRPDLVRAGVGDALDVLADVEHVVGDRFGIVGLGGAGAAARWMSTMDPRVVACVTFGGLEAPVGMEPDYRGAGCAYLGHLPGDGSADGAVSLEIRLRELGLDATFHVYRGAGRGFEDPADAAFEDASADLAWERTRLFLDRHL
jgi:carboxymethylenebutenolidase